MCTKVTGRTNIPYPIKAWKVVLKSNQNNIYRNSVSVSGRSYPSCLAGGRVMKGTPATSIFHAMYSAGGNHAYTEYPDVCRTECPDVWCYVKAVPVLIWGDALVFDTSKPYDKAGYAAEFLTADVEE